MSRRKRGTTNIAVSVEEIHILRDGLRNYTHRLEVDNLDTRLVKALNRCKQNGGKVDA